MREQGLSIGQGISVMAKHKLRNSLLVALLVGVANHMAFAEEAAGLKDEVARQARALEGKLIERRRDIHAYPELGNQETRTAPGPTHEISAISAQRVVSEAGTSRQARCTHF